MENLLFDLLGGVFPLIRDIIVGIAIITLLLATLQCFLGYKLLKFWVAVCGFFTFGILGGAIGFASSREVGIVIFSAILCSIIGAFIAFKLYKAGIFILCGLAGFLLGYLLTQDITMAVVMALVLGILSVLFLKPVVIISTSVSGGLLAGSSLATVLDLGEVSSLIVFSVIFIVLGLLVQFVTNRNTNRLVTATSDHVQADQQNHSMEQFNGTVSNITEALSSTMSSATQRANEITSDVSTKIKGKIALENDEAMKDAKGLTYENLIENLRELCYSNKIIRNIMPFSSYILIGLAVISPISNIIFGMGLTISSSLVLLCSVLCLAKKQSGVMAISFGLIALGNLMGVFIFHPYYYSKIQLFTPILELAIFTFLTILFSRAFFKSEKGIDLKNKLKNMGVNVSIASSTVTYKIKTREVIMVRCTNCGELNKETASFCASCGNKLTVEIKSCKTDTIDTPQAIQVEEIEGTGETI